MNKRQAIEKALAALGIKNEEQLNAAIKAMKPLDLSTMVPVAAGSRQRAS